MIFSTFQAGQTGGHTGADTHRLGTAARHSLDALLTELYQPVTREWLGRHLPNLEEGRGLHLASGNGKDSLMLAGLLHGQTALLGLEEDTVLIQSARQTSDVQDHERMQFVQGNLSNCNADKLFDFIYTRIWSAGLSDQDALLQTIRHNLVFGGSLLLEVVPLSGFSAYPYNHAFARSMELIGLLEEPRSGTAVLQPMLQQAGFDTLEMTWSMPAFIPGNCNRVVSLALEWCRDGILRCRGSTVEELNALLLELKQFEKQEDTLISRTGLLQVFATKR